MTRKSLLILVFVALAVIVAITVTGIVLWERFTLDSPLQTQVEAELGDVRFNYLAYEVTAIAEKVVALVERPGIRLSPEEQRQLVREYHYRAFRISWLEDAVYRVYADPDVSDPRIESAELQAELDRLQALQLDARPIVEGILERQVAAKLQELDMTKAGIVWPPVRFRFAELPKYLILSPRDRIQLEAGIMLHENLNMAQIEEIEEGVTSTFDRSALVDSLGGLGVWPTLVLDDASLSWILSTIAHEWVHTYLAFHPLGWHMFDSAEMNMINETVAAIIGDEIGQQLAFELYGIPLPSEEIDIDWEELLAEPDPDEFDFRTEMRRTRLQVDELLANGQIEEAETYMEERRREFVENGFYIRKLNQAYFAFHGSYATRAAASDPIGPNLQNLRDWVPDLTTFLHAVQGIGDANEFNRLVQEWRDQAGVQAAPVEP